MLALADDVQAIKSKGAKGIDITSELAKSIAFVVVSVHMWRGQYHIKGAKVEVSGEELSDKLTTKPRWHLMPPKWREKFTAIESKLKACIGRARILNPETDDEDVGELLRFPIRGLSIVPRSRLINLFEELEAIEHGEWKTAVEDFSKDWPNIVEWAKNEVKGHPPEVWNIIDSLLPSSPKAAAERFFIDRIVIPIKLDGATDLEYLSGTAADQYVGKMKEYGRNFTERVANTIIAGLQDELGNAVDTLVNRIGEGGVIKNSNLSTVRNVFEKFRAFDFLMTPDLQGQMDSLSAQLNEFDCSDLNKALKDSGASSVTFKIAEHLKKVRSQCMDQTALARAHGRGGRTIRV